MNNLDNRNGGDPTVFFALPGWKRPRVGKRNRPS